MIKGLVLDPRIWKIDYNASKYWAPQKYGVKIDLHENAFGIPKSKQSLGKYQFVIATEVWEIPMRETLQYLRDKGMKVFLCPREPFKTGVLKSAMFEYERFFHKNSYYFNPDAVLSPGPAYSELWEGKTKVINVGYPRWDFYVDKSSWPQKDYVASKFGLDSNKKTIFFPSFPPYHLVEGKMVKLYDERNQILETLLNFVNNNSDYQVVVKIHPMSFKCYRKKTGNGNEVSGILEQYYKKPAHNFKVIGDIRNSGMEAKELLIFSDIVVGFTSTMLLEAATAGKDVIHVLLGKCKDIKGLAEFKDYMPTAYTTQELVSQLKANTQGSYEDLIYRYFYKVDGKFCQRFCRAIKDNL